MWLAFGLQYCSGALKSREKSDETVGTVDV